MSVSPAPFLPQRYYDGNNVPLVGGKLFTYAAGTTTKQATYTDATGKTQNTNPVILNARGEAPVFLDDSLSYKLVLAPATDTDPPSAPIWTEDNISTANYSPSFTPQSYGAQGDGVTNDTLAFQSLSTAFNAAGGGVIELTPGATYVVGLQTFVNAGIYTWQGQSILSLSGCTKPVIIRGNGAKFLVAPGLYFGTFDSNSNPTFHSLPFSSSQACTTAVDGIISVKSCTAPVLIEDVEVDGNSANLKWGGPFGNTGWQLPADLFFIASNTGGVTIRRCRGHNGSRDGLQSMGGTSPGADKGYSDRFRIENCNFYQNTRNNWSPGSGRGYHIENTSFNHAGKNTGAASPGFSSPGANVDLEAFVGGDQLRDFEFVNCEFIDAAGNSLNADSGDVANVLFEDCRFVGTSAWGVWCVKPFIRFRRCLIAGGFITNIPRILTDYGMPPACAEPVFDDCTFTDDPTYSPTGSLFVSAGSGAVSNGNLDLGLTRFNRCKFRTGYNASGFQTLGGYFVDCTFDNGTIASSCYAPHLQGQTTITDSSSGIILFVNPPTGKWGSNINYGVLTTGNTHSSTTLDGLASTTGISVGMTVNGAGIPTVPPTTVAAISGSSVTLSQAATATATGVSVSFTNQMRRGTATYDAPSIANGARTTTTVSVPWARFRDRVKVTLAESVQGINVAGYVSTAATSPAGGGVVTVTLDNFTGGSVDLASTTLDVALEDRELA